jgi:succinate-semialdehyde dehydrogenase / glutarate-semialdehyde dehydrogenase
LIFADADLDAAMEAIFALKWRHAGQACITANRIYVERPVYEKFTDMMLKKVKTLKIGHGSDPETTLGPITISRGLEKAESMVEDARTKGARILSGGKKLDLNGGYFFDPTVIADAKEDMLVAQEEQFAPIAALFPFDSEAEVVEKANSTSVSRVIASMPILTTADGSCQLLLHQKCGQNLASFGKPGSRNDWHEHW